MSRSAPSRIAPRTGRTASGHPRPKTTLRPRWPRSVRADRRAPRSARTDRGQRGRSVVFGRGCPLAVLPVRGAILEGALRDIDTDLSEALRTQHLAQLRRTRLQGVQGRRVMRAEPHLRVAVFD